MSFLFFSYICDLADYFACSYYLTRTADIPPRQLEMLRTAGFDPLTRIPFHMIGQDMALNELLRVLANHSRQAVPSPVSVIFAGKQKLLLLCSCPL